MADADQAGQSGGEREVARVELNRVCAERYPDGYTLEQRADVALELTRPAPAPGLAAREFEPGLREVTDATVSQTAAREAAVEAVARELHRAWGGGGLEWETPGGWQASWRASAERLLSLPEVVAFIAAAGQNGAPVTACTHCGHPTEQYSQEDGVGCLAAPFIDPCDACPCTEPGISQADQ